MNLGGPSEKHTESGVATPLKARTDRGFNPSEHQLLEQKSRAPSSGGHQMVAMDSKPEVSAENMVNFRIRKRQCMVLVTARPQDEQCFLSQTGQSSLRAMA